MSIGLNLKGSYWMAVAKQKSLWIEIKANDESCG